MKTRKAKSTPSSQEPSASSSSSTTAIPIPAEEDPVKLLLLPSDASPAARICTLAHPATSKPCRYYFCPRSGVYEFQRIAAPRGDCRSWLLGRKVVVRAVAGQPEDVENEPQEEVNGVEDYGAARSISQGHTIKNPELFIATPIDALFLILPTLHAQSQRSAKGLFLALDDLLESAGEGSKHLKHVVEPEAMQRMMERRVAAVCDTVDAGDEKMYRLSLTKLVMEILAKAKRMSAKGLPASMEAKFVTKALEKPVMSLKREESSVSQGAIDSLVTDDSQPNNIVESQQSTITDGSTVSVSSAQTDVTVPDPVVVAPSAPEDIYHLLRLRTALHIILTGYLPTHLATAINDILSSTSSPIDFNPLDVHLNHLATLRAEAQASRSQADFSRKRNAVEDEEAAEAKAEKRRKKEEDEKRQKAGLTKGIRDLKKVDVKGMKKMSDFFGKSSGGKKT
ncbi:MAG: hypothetical protein LQ348_003458 [Seirophora lacunosa]|nr:MAG: hypothetical protein LQ348_003458 [Seirophora lacunosa]